VDDVEHCHRRLRNEPELATLWSEISERRAANMRLFAADLAAAALLRVDIDRAADIVWATNSPELYRARAADHEVADPGKAAVANGGGPDLAENYVAR
jgi:hypothetical protein